MGAAGGALFVVTGVLLLSMGGAIVAAPLTLPLLWLVSRQHPTPAYRWTSGVLAGLTAGELAWAAVYLLVGEGTVWIWLVPAVVTVGVVAAFVRPGAPGGRRPGTTSPPRRAAPGTGSATG